MFFRFLGQAVRRGWPAWLILWLAVLLISWRAAPPWKQVAQDKEFAFLPASAPSRQAEEIYAKAFPTDRLASNIVLVLHRADDERPHLKDDLAFIDGVLEPRLRKIAEDEGGFAFAVQSSDEPLFADDAAPKPAADKPHKRSNIAGIQTPNTPGVGGLLVSPDDQALLVIIQLASELLSDANWPTIDKVRHTVEELNSQHQTPPGLEISLTGSAVIGRDHTVAQLQSVRATHLLTVILIVVLLILIYRAPLLALIPIATVFIAVQLSLNLLSILAAAKILSLFEGIQIYTTILVYGAGVDYCLFLTARYREELDRGKTPGEAVAAAVGDVGSAVVASAGTVMCGIGMMAFAQFGKFHDAGIAIPISLFVALAATLTFSTALLILAGRWAFWPQHLAVAVAGREPPPPDSELERIWDRIGKHLLRRPAAIWLATVLAMTPFVIVAVFDYSKLSYDLIGDLPADSLSVAGTRQLREHFPAGIVGPVTILLVDDKADFSTGPGRAAVVDVTDRLREQAENLGLADVRSLPVPLGITPAADRDLFHLDVPADVRLKESERLARQHYVGDLGDGSNNVTRIDLILKENPFSHQSVDDAIRIERAVRDALPSAERPNVMVYLVGETASVHDLERVMTQDRTRIEVLVLASVFVVLVLLLRQFLVPAYLLLSVVFSYYTTLGVSFLVFSLLDPHGFTGIDWKVAIFLFTILIAVGEDYNIFLMSRVHEEQRRHGPLLGITVAMDRTGPIISSCGVIMAGTFASLLAGSLTEMKQLGFALAFGVLLDTFIVRPILVPAFLILVRKGFTRQPQAVPPEPMTASHHS
jgi:RND superfamily putative drug exporter